MIFCSLAMTVISSRLGRRRFHSNLQTARSKQLSSGYGHLQKPRQTHPGRCPLERRLSSQQLCTWCFVLSLVLPSLKTERVYWFPKNSQEGNTALQSEDFSRQWRGEARPQAGRKSLSLMGPPPRIHVRSLKSIQAAERMKGDFTVWGCLLLSRVLSGCLTRG